MARCDLLCHFFGFGRQAGACRYPERGKSYSAGRTDLQADRVRSTMGKEAWPVWRMTTKSWRHGCSISCIDRREGSGVGVACSPRQSEEYEEN